MKNFDITKENEFFNDVYCGHTDRVTQAVGNDPNLVYCFANQYSLNPVHIAALQGNLEMMMILNPREISNSLSLSEKVLSPFLTDKAKRVYVLDLLAMMGDLNSFSSMYDHMSLSEEVAAQVLTDCLKVAALNGHFDFVNGLINHPNEIIDNVVGIHDKVLGWFSHGGHFNCLKKYLKFAQEQEIQLSYDQLLMGAARGGHITLLFKLISYLKTMNLPLVFNKGSKHLLHAAAEYGHLDAVVELDKRLDNLKIDSLTDHGETVFHLAAGAMGISFDKLLKFINLYQHRIPLTAKDTFGNSILHCSVQGFNVENAFKLSNQFSQLDLNAHNNANESLMDAFILSDKVPPCFLETSRQLKMLICAFGFSPNEIGKYSSLGFNNEAISASSPPHVYLKSSLLSFLNLSMAGLFENDQPFNYETLKFVLLYHDLNNSFDNYRCLPVSDMNNQLLLQSLIQSENVDMVTLYLQSISTAKNLTLAYRNLISKNKESQPKVLDHALNPFLRLFCLTPFENFTSRQLNTFHLAVARCNVVDAVKVVFNDDEIIDMLKNTLQDKKRPYFGHDLSIVLTGLLGRQLAAGPGPLGITNIKTHDASCQKDTSFDKRSRELIALIAKRLKRDDVLCRFMDILLGGKGGDTRFSVSQSKQTSTSTAILLQLHKIATQQQAEIQAIKERLESKKVSNSK